LRLRNFAGERVRADEPQVDIGLGPEIPIVISATIRARLAIRHEWELVAKSRPKGQIPSPVYRPVAWWPH
jgi:hypothetical protein